MPGVGQVTELEADYVTGLFTLAFHDDPTWGWAFPDAAKRHEHHRLWWGYASTAQCRTDGFG
jgi:hypothetical protein